MSPHGKHTFATDVLVSIVMSTIMNAGMTFVILGGADWVPVWGVGAALFGLAPATFMTAFMSSAVPGFIAGRRRRSGTVAAIAGQRRWLPGTAFDRGLIVGTVAMIAVVLAAAAIALAGRWETLSFGANLAIQIGLAIAIPPIVTPFAIREALSH